MRSNPQRRRVRTTALRWRHGTGAVGRASSSGYYQVEKFLDECVKSVVAQTYRNLEILLVDDGSPDNCPAMCDAWAARDPRVRVIHKPNGGLSDARNTGIAGATGAYIYFADSDDTVAPTSVEDCLNAMREYDADLVICSSSTPSPRTTSRCCPTIATTTSPRCRS